MARVSLELGSRGTAHYESLSAIPIDDFIARRVEGPRRRRGRARARDRPRAAALAAAARAAVRARQRRHPRATRSGSTPTPATRPRSPPPRARRASTSSSSAPRRRWSAGLADALAAAGVRCFGPIAAAARLEGSKAFAKEIMAAAGVPTGGARGRARPSTSGHGRDRRLPGGDQGRRAGGGQGRRDRRRRGGGARARWRRCSSQRRFGDHPVAGRGVPRRRRALAARAVRRRARACRSRPRATTSASATATPGPNTGGMGAFSPVAGDATRCVDDAIARPSTSRSSTSSRAAARRSTASSTPG